MMAQQASQVTAKMQGVLNNRDTEIMQRKAKVHKRLARHVARTCQARRRLCKVRARGRVLISGAVAAVGFVAAACVHFFPPPR